MWRDPDFANVFRRRAKVAEVMAGATGGSHRSFFHQRSVEKLVSELSEELHAQYLLSFAPGLGRDGFRPIRVEVRDRPELVVRTRAGYWAG